MLAAPTLNPAGDVTDRRTCEGPINASSAGYTGKPAKAVGGTTDIYLCIVDRCVETSVVYVVTVGVGVKIACETTMLAMIMVVSEATEVVGAGDVVCVLSVMVTEDRPCCCVVGVRDTVVAAPDVECCESPCMLGVDVATGKPGVMHEQRCVAWGGLCNWSVGDEGGYEGMLSVRGYEVYFL